MVDLIDQYELLKITYEKNNEENAIEKIKEYNDNLNVINTKAEDIKININEDFAKNEFKLTFNKIFGIGASIKANQIGPDYLYVINPLMPYLQLANIQDSTIVTRDLILDNENFQVPYDANSVTYLLLLCSKQTSLALGN